MAIAGDNVSVTTDISSYISITPQYSAVAYGTLSAGTNNNVAPNQATGIYNFTVDTNRNYTLKALGTDFSEGGGGSFEIGNLTMDSDPSAGSLAEGNSVALATTNVTIDSNIVYTVTDHYHGYWLDIPSGQKEGSYSSTVTISYENV